MWSNKHYLEYPNYYSTKKQAHITSCTHTSTYIHVHMQFGKTYLHTDCNVQVLWISILTIYPLVYVYVCICVPCAWLLCHPKMQPNHHFHHFVHTKCVRVYAFVNVIRLLEDVLFVVHRILLPLPLLMVVFPVVLLFISCLNISSIFMVQRTTMTTKKVEEHTLLAP